MNIDRNWSKAQQQATDGDAAQLSAAQLRNLRVARWAAQRLHGFVQLVVDGPSVAGVDFALQLPTATGHVSTWARREHDVPSG